MKKIQRLIPLVFILFTLLLGAACGKKAASNTRAVSPTPSTAVQQNKSDAPPATEKELNASDNKQPASNSLDEAQNETTPTPEVQEEEKSDAKEQNSAEAVREEVPSTSTGYKGLQGEALLKAVLQKNPDKLFVVTESISGEIKSKSTSYLYHDFMRNEADSDEGKQVLIYNPEEETTYTYNEDLKTGMKFADGEDAAAEGGLINEEDYEDFEGLISAELTTLDGEEVIYMIAVVEDEGISSETRMWISTKYKYPLATEIYYNGMLAAKSMVLEISDDFKMDDTLFTVPDDIQFIDFDSFDFLDGMGELDFTGE